MHRRWCKCSTPTLHFFPNGERQCTRCKGWTKKLICRTLRKRQLNYPTREKVLGTMDFEERDLVDFLLGEKHTLKRKVTL